MCDIIFVVFIYLNHLYVYVYTCTRTCTRTVRVSCFLAIILSSPGKRRLRVLYSSCTLVLYSTRTVREGPTVQVAWSTQAGCFPNRARRRHTLTRAIRGTRARFSAPLALAEALAHPANNITLSSESTHSVSGSASLPHDVYRTATQASGT